MPQAPPRRPHGRQSILHAVYEDNRDPTGAPRRTSRFAARPAPPRHGRNGRAVLGGLLAVIVAISAWGAVRFAPSAPPDAPLATANVSSDAATLALRRARPARDDADVAELLNLQVRTIVIDPGHGGHDPGAIGPDRLEEKAVTLDVARRLRDRLVEHDAYQVLLTREDDETVSLGDRVSFANEVGADLYVSVHVNALPDPSVAPVETYYFGVEAEPTARALAHAENEGNPFSVAEFNDALRRAGTAVKLQESSELAHAVQRALVERTELGLRRTDWGAKPAPFAVLLHTDAPAILAEITALSNPTEEARLRTTAYRDAIAAALEAGVLAYLRRPLPSADAPPDGRQKDLQVR